MRATIERCMTTELSKQTWEFTLYNDFAKNAIYFNRYVVSFKHSTRERIWKVDKHWERRDRRSNNIQVPPLPEDVVNEAKQIFCHRINELEITQ